MQIDPPLDVFIPNPARSADFITAQIDPASGIVGSNAQEWLTAKYGEPMLGRSETALTIDYEGNRYNAINIVTWADRVSHAADRHRTHYPSVARHVAEPTDLIHVGTFDGTQVTLEPVAENIPLLADWLGIAPGTDEAIAEAFSRECRISDQMTRVP